MNINDLENFRLSDAVKFHPTLNKRIFTNDRLQEDVRDQLMTIADDFIEFMGIDSLKVEDVRLYGSNAAYTYTKHSDLDLHVLIDMSSIDDDEVYSELFNSKKRLYNDSLDITVRGMPVELYMQDAKEQVKSLGDYSVLNDRWVKFPTKSKSSIEEHSVKEKFKRLVVLAELALRSDDITILDELLDTIRRYRQAGLSQGGEFSPENLAYKALRSKGIVDKLYKHRDRLHSDELSIDEDVYEDAGDEYTEIEFVCANPDFPDATDPQLQQKLYNELKAIPGVIAVLQDQGGYSEGQMSLSALFKDPNLQQFIEKTARTLGVKIDMIQPRNSDYFQRAKSGNLEGQLMESSTPKITINAHREGNSVVIDWFNVVPSRQGQGSKAYFDWESQLPEDIKYIKLYASDAGEGNSEGFWDQMGFDWTDEPGYMIKRLNHDLKESSGYIPSSAERDDPRFKTALSIDVDPNIMPRQARAMGLGTIKRDGRPQQLNPSGKFTR